MNSQSLAFKAVVLLVVSGLVAAGLRVLQGPGAGSSGESLAMAQTPAAVPAPASKNRFPAWTTSRIAGSPEPPSPYKVVRAFPKLTFKNPTLMAFAPGSSRVFVGEQAGKIFSFPNDQACTTPDLFIDMTKLTSFDSAKYRATGNLYGLAFHPQFEKNHYCYICFVFDDKNGGSVTPEGSRVSRFTVTGDPPRCDPKSEKVVITWLGGGHNGGCLEFGPDGFLYISTGDGSFPNPPDARHTGQDCSDLLSSILRIDVDHEDGGKAYRVPADNPLLKYPGTKPEIWAYGFRNPWKMTFDRKTGDLWAGDVGWELWEMVYRVQKGGNYGWSVMEGRQSVRPAEKRGPTPILPPTIDFPHTEAASITGGYVYRGKKYPDLQGAYVCGDWVTRKLWGTRVDASGKILEHRVLVQSNQRVVAFGQDHEGELYFLAYDDRGTIHQLVPNDVKPGSLPPFPRKLSESGLFTSVAAHKTAPGVIPFEINAAQWLDHATAERFIGFPSPRSGEEGPGVKSVVFHDEPRDMPESTFNGRAHFPKDAVLAKTISLEMERGNPASRRRLETQILHFDGNNWKGYTYRWNAEQTDATLVDAGGAEETFIVKDREAPGGQRAERWHFASRGECITCHNPWAGYGLAFTPAQLQRDEQLQSFVDAGLVRLADKKSVKEVAGLAEPHGTKGDIDARARAYLQANCAHCHQFGAGGTADIELRTDYAIDRTKTLEIRPAQGDFGIRDAQILAPGDPYRSVLYYRMSKVGRGRMPHIGSEVVDDQGLKLIHDWIRQLPVRKDERLQVQRLRDLDEATVLKRETQQMPQWIRWRAESLAREELREKPTDADRAKAEEQWRKEAAERVPQRARDRVNTIASLLSSTTGSAMLARAMADGTIPESIRPMVLSAAASKNEVVVRDLFERFLPDDQRVARLGSLIKPEQLLGRKGDAARGKALFFENAAVQCKNCHRVKGVGSTLGPDLSEIAKKYDRAKILENILEPSKEMEPKYIPYLVETDDGRTFTGLIISQDNKELVLRDVRDQEVRIAAKKVMRQTAQKVSLMPEQLLRDLTADQAADLLEYLSTLK